MTLTLREAVSKAIPFTTRAIENHHVVILSKGFVSATNGMSGCSIGTEDTLGFKSNTSVAVDATKLRKVLTTMTPEDVSVKRNVLHLKDASGEIKISGLTKAALPIIPTVSDDVVSWSLPEAQTKAIRALADASSVLNARESLQGIHITSTWMAVLSSRMVCLLWAGLPDLTDDISTVPCDMWRKLNVVESNLMLDGNRMIIEQDGNSYWSLLATSSITPGSVDALVTRAREQTRREGTVQVQHLADQAKRAIACGDSPATVYRATVSKGNLTLTGDAGAARLESSIVWSEVSNPENLDEQHIGLAADHLGLTSTTLKSIVVDGPISLSVCGPTDPLVVWGQGADGTLMEVFMSPSHLPR